VSCPHPLATARRLRWKDLAHETWLLAPAGTAARAGLDELVSEFPQPPRTHALVTRSPTMMGWLPRHEPVLAFLPLNFALPLIDAGEVHEVNVRPANPIEPLGLLRPLGGTPLAAGLLCAYLGEHFAALRRGAAWPQPLVRPGSA